MLLDAYILATNEVKEVKGVASECMSPFEGF